MSINQLAPASLMVCLRETLQITPFNVLDTGDDEVNSTVTAAPYVWKLLQAFYANFPEYESRDFGLFTESYGGHYGPEFAGEVIPSISSQQLMLSF